MELLYFSISFLFLWIVYLEQQRRNRAIQRASRYRAYLQRRQQNALRGSSRTANAVEVRNLFNRNVAVVLGIAFGVYLVVRIGGKLCRLVHLEIIGGERTYAYPKVRSTLFALNYVPLFQEVIKGLY